MLTHSVGDGGLAGTIDLAEPLDAATNDARFGPTEGEMAG